MANVARMLQEEEWSVQAIHMSLEDLSILFVTEFPGQDNILLPSNIFDLCLHIRQHKFFFPSSQKFPEHTFHGLLSR